MRARVHSLVIDIDLIDTADDLLAASSAAISANFDFTAARAGAGSDAGSFRGLVRTNLTHQGAWTSEVLAQMVVLEAALSGKTPKQVLESIEHSLPDPNGNVPLAQLPVEETATA